MFWFRKTWSATWKDHVITAHNAWNPLLMGHEELTIDGDVQDSANGWARFSAELSASIEGNETTHEVRAHIGNIDLGFRSGCKIFVDGKLIGGDIDKRFIT